MYISEELIREFQKQANASYEEAEKYLRKANGDINLAISRYKKRNISTGKIKKVIINVFSYKLIIKRKKEIIINLPIWFIILFLILIDDFGYNKLFPYFVMFIIALVGGCEFRIEKSNSHTNNDEVLEKIIIKRKDYKKDINEKREENNFEDINDNKPTNEEGSNEDYYEIVIED